ncbi:Amino acid transporter, transmembrane domain [Cinara cedri]|uniref:Amino acid transporter, transmembrane domain n=1 Tax=Cinara cedri TaxID=506608 RepID=A0A5E4NJC0_9HEMI|nr:Amino acid transporter, transmembrane domain [Cinara cedri]
MDFPMKSIDSCLVYMTVYLALLLVPSVKNLEPLKVLGKITFTAVLLCYFYSHMYATDIQIDHQSLFRGDWREVFHFFGILLFSFVPVFQLLKIEDELIKPEDFVRGPSFSLLHITMVIITNMYISVGLWGYLTFDCIPKIGYSVLTVIPASRLLDFVKICFVTCIVSSHQELCLESVALLWSSSITKAVEKVTDRFSFSEMSWLVAGTKIVFTFSSFLAAVLFVVPDGGVPAAPAMAALGYAGNGWNVLVYPYTIELCLTHAQHGTWARPHVIAKDALAVVLGLAVSAVGVYATVTRTSPGDGDVDGT